MSDKFRKPCIRCLLRESGEEQTRKSIQDYMGRTTEESRAEAAEYESRLSVCMDCKWLNRGVCQKCGTYVEARAYRKENHCPLGEKLW